MGLRQGIALTAVSALPGCFAAASTPAEEPTTREAPTKLAGPEAGLDPVSCAPLRPILQAIGPDSARHGPVLAEVRFPV